MYLSERCHIFHLYYYYYCTNNYFLFQTMGHKRVVDGSVKLEQWHSYCFTVKDCNTSGLLYNFLPYFSICVLTEFVYLT